MRRIELSVLAVELNGSALGREMVGLRIQRLTRWPTRRVRLPIAMLLGWLTRRFLIWQTLAGQGISREPRWVILTLIAWQMWQEPVRPPMRMLVGWAKGLDR
jgi:hypothetical protein